MLGRKSDLIQVGVKNARERGLKLRGCKRKKDILTRKGRETMIWDMIEWEKKMNVVYHY